MRKPLILFVIVFAFAAVAAADVFVPSSAFTGSVSSTNSAQTTVCGNGCGWSTNTVTLTWKIEDNGDGTFKYSYTFDAPNGNISHWILEVSSTFTSQNMWNLSVSPSGQIDVNSPGTYSSGSGNPGLPSDIFGIKIDASCEEDVECDPFVVTFISDRAPVWGDFYAKDGTAGSTGTGQNKETNWLINYQFGNDPTGSTTDFSGWIPTPDTLSHPEVPEPGTMILLGSGMLGAGSLLRRRFKK